MSSQGGADGRRDAIIPELHFLEIRGLKGGPLGYSVSRFVVRAYGRVATACCHEVARAIILYCWIELD